MRVFADTSALTKLYIEEEHSDEVAVRVATSTGSAVSRVAYPEARAALARRFREGGMDAPGYRRAVDQLDRDFDRLTVIELMPALARRSGELAETRCLRGFDAVHLASALRYGELAGEAPFFLCFDDRLREAAAAEGLPV